MDKKELDLIIKKHKAWLNNEHGGNRADLSGANLRGADLRGANLRCANLRDADLSDADLSGANLRCANLRGANLRCANLRDAYLSDADLSGANLRCANLRCANLSDADLSDADLSGADLSGANLSGADLRDADLSDADLSDADLSGADLSGANLSGADLRDADLSGTNNIDNLLWDIYTAFYPMQCPESGAYTAYKRASGRIVELMIPADAKRSSATSRKCRASKAIVVSITDIYGNAAENSVISDYDKNFVYTVGETVEVNNFDENRWNECAAGIHHYITRSEAVRHS